MDRIGVRELRQYASRYLDRVAEGETIEITEHGRLVALLVPPTESGVRARMVLTGQLAPGRGDLLEHEPLQVPGHGPSDRLAQMRATER